MAVLSVFGVTGAVEQGKKYSWTPSTGEILTQTFRGVATNVKTLYDTYKAAGMSNPDYDSMNLDMGRGNALLIITKAGDATNAVYELLSNDITRPIWTAPYFVEEVPVLTATQISQVMAAYHHIQYMTETTPTPDPSTFTGKQLELYRAMEHGIQEYNCSSYVLRETKLVTWRSQVSASFDNVNAVDTPPNTAAVNTLIGPLPDGQWLKRAPNVVQVGRRRWQIVTEWWWARKWLMNVYPGGLLELT